MFLQRAFDYLISIAYFFFVLAEEEEEEKGEKQFPELS